jgi:hypothetical protein
MRIFNLVDSPHTPTEGGGALGEKRAQPTTYFFKIHYLPIVKFIFLDKMIQILEICIKLIVII